MSSCQRTVQPPLPNQGEEKRSLEIFSGWYISYMNCTYPNPSYRQDHLCLESHLDKPPGGGGEMLKWWGSGCPTLKSSLTHLFLSCHTSSSSHILLASPSRSIKKPAPSHCFSLCLVAQTALISHQAPCKATCMVSTSSTASTVYFPHVLKVGS